VYFLPFGFSFCISWVWHISDGTARHGTERKGKARNC
jgi:hypothetical protein